MNELTFSLLVVGGYSSLGCCYNLSQNVIEMQLRGEFPFNGPVNVPPQIREFYNLQDRNLPSQLMMSDDHPYLVLIDAVDNLPNIRGNQGAPSLLRVLFESDNQSPPSATQRRLSEDSPRRSVAGNSQANLVFI